MASLRSTRQDALMSMNIGFLQLPPHLKSRCLRLTFKPDFLRVTCGAFGLFRTGKYGDFEMLPILNVLFHCKIFAENPIIDITCYESKVRETNIPQRWTVTLCIKKSIIGLLLSWPARLLPNARGESRTKQRELDFDPSGTVVQGNRPTIRHDFKLMSTGDIFDEEKRDGGIFANAYITVFNSLMKNTFAKYGKIGLRWSLEPKLSTLAQKTASRIFKNRSMVLNYLFAFLLASSVKVSGQYPAKFCYFKILKQPVTIKILHASAPASSGGGEQRSPQRFQIQREKREN